MQLQIFHYFISIFEWYYSILIIHPIVIFGHNYLFNVIILWISCEKRDHIGFLSYYLVIYNITSGNGRKAGLLLFP